MKKQLGEEYDVMIPPPPTHNKSMNGENKTISYLALPIHPVLKGFKWQGERVEIDQYTNPTTSSMAVDFVSDRN